MNEQSPVKSPWIAYLGLLVGSFTIIEALSFQIPVVPVVTKVFNIPVASAAFIALAYYLTHIVAGPVFGNLADQYGRKRIVLIGQAIFAISEFMAALSPNFLIFLLARFIQGIGAGCIVSSGVAYASYLFPPHKRGAAIGTFTSIGTIGAAVGGIIGGMVVSKFGWQYVYYINGTLALIGMLIVAAFVPETPRLEKKPFDYLGSVLLLLTVGTLLSVTTLVSNLGAGSPTTLGVLALGIALAVTLVIVEKRSNYPFIELGLLKNRLFILPLVIYFLIQVSNTGAMMANSFFVNAMPGGGPMAVGKVSMYTYIAGALAGYTSGRLIDKIRIKQVLFIGVAVFLAGGIAFTRFTPSTPLWYIITAICLFTAGICIMNPACIKMALSVVPGTKLGSGSGTYTMLQYMGNPAGQSIGLAVFGSLSATTLAAQLTNVAQNAGVTPEMMPAVLQAGKSAGKVVDPSLVSYLSQLGIKFQDLYSKANVEAMVGALNQLSFYILGATVLVLLLLAIFIPSSPVAKVEPKK